MSFMVKRRKELNIQSIADLKRAGKIKTKKDPELFVHGPEYFDCLEDKWSKKEVLGIIGGSGSGKSQISLEMFRGILNNSKNPDSICIFIALEMTVDRIATRWFNLVGEDSPLTERLYVITNFDENEKPKEMTISDIVKECLQYKNILDTEIDAVCVDHLHIVNSQGESTNKIAQRVKDMAVELNTFAILLSQTTKGKSGALCDKPLDADASYDCSQFKWISSYIITVHQPIAMLADDTKMHCLAWGYQKIRERSNNDGVSVGRFNILSYEMDSGRLRSLTPVEKINFEQHIKTVYEYKKEEGEDSFAMYDIESTLDKTLSGVDLVALDKEKEDEA